MWSPTEALAPDPAGALTIGPVARKLLRDTVCDTGTVYAVFPPVVYLALGGGLVVVARAGIEAGALTVQTDIPPGFDFRLAGIAPADRVSCAPDEIRIGRRLRIRLGRARKWSPEPLPPDPCRNVVRQGLVAIHAMTQKAALTDRIDRPNNAQVAETAAARIAMARAWMRRGGMGDTGWARALVGLGPGLTPSGDDFLGGAMITLHGIGKASAAARLWQSISPAVPGTTPISQALLAAAAEGLGGASVHRLLAALLSGGETSPALERLLRIGHSSGRDTLAGIVSVLEASFPPGSGCAERSGRLTRS